MGMSDGATRRERVKDVHDIIIIGGGPAGYTAAIYAARANLSPYVLLPDGHPLGAHERIALKDLLAERLVLLDAPPSREYFLSLFDGVGEPKVGYRAQSFEMVRGMVAHGLGYSLLATRPASAMSYDGKSLITRAIADPIASSRLVLCQRRGAVLDRATSRFREHCIALLNAAAV